MDIGRAGVQIVGAHRVADRFALPAERYAVLIVVGSVADQIAQLDQPPGHLQIFGLAGGAIQLNRAHVVRGTDGTSRELRSGLGQQGVEIIGGFAGHVQQTGLAGGPVVNACGSEQMAQVIRFELQRIGERFRYGIAGAGGG